MGEAVETRKVSYMYILSKVIKCTYYYNYKMYIVCVLPIQKFCSTVLSHIGSSDPSVSWAAKTQALALTSLKIIAREREGIEELISPEGLLVIAKLAELSSASSHNTENYESQEKVNGKYIYKHVHGIHPCSLCTL